MFAFPDGKAVVEVNGTATFSSPAGGKSVTLDSTLKITDTSVARLLAGGARSITVKSIATGLNYRIPQPRGPVRRLRLVRAVCGLRLRSGGLTGVSSAAEALRESSGYGVGDDGKVTKGSPRY